MAEWQEGWCHLFAKILFQNQWKKKNDGELADPRSPGKRRDSRQQAVTIVGALPVTVFACLETVFISAAATVHELLARPTLRVKVPLMNVRRTRTRPGRQLTDIYAPQFPLLLSDDESLTSATQPLFSLRPTWAIISIRSDIQPLAARTDL